MEEECGLQKHRVLKSQKPLGQVIIFMSSCYKRKHNREKVGKICPNMKLTPPCTPLPQKALDKD